DPHPEVLRRPELHPVRAEARDRRAARQARRDARREPAAPAPLALAARDDGRRPPEDPRRPRRARRTATAVRDAGAQVSRAALAAGLAVAVYVACLRRYGIFDPADEGLLLVQAWRTAHGQMPYVDFHTGYGPLYFRLQSILVAAGGLAAVRWMLVLIHGAAAAFLYALARRLCGPALAA